MLLKENKPVGAWWIYDGANHGLITAGVIAVTKGVLYNLGISTTFALIALVVTVGVFIYLEHKQETALVKEFAGARKYHWAQRRWQDVGFPVVFGTIAYLVLP